jgi:hypothetical protein
MRTSSRLVVTAALCALLATTATACGRSEPAAQTATTTEATASTTSGPTTAPTTTQPTLTGQTLPDGQCAPSSGGDPQGGWFLTALRQARNGTDDRVVWEFRPQPGRAVGAAPAYTVESAAPPFREDPSDLVLDVPGTTGLRIRFANATGVDLTRDEPERTYSGERRVVTGREPLTAVVDGGDFEGQSIWLLGLSRQVCPTVSTLSDPVRVVVDIPAG